MAGKEIRRSSTSSYTALGVRVHTRDNTTARERRQQDEEGALRILGEVRYSLSSLHSNREGERGQEMGKDQSGEKVK